MGHDMTRKGTLTTVLHSTVTDKKRRRRKRLAMILTGQIVRK